MKKETAEHVADVLRAIGNPVRLQVIELLRDREVCVGDIVEALGEKQAVISHQLNLMKDKGVLASRRDGAKVYYRVENANVIDVLDCVQRHCKTGKGG
ncbi:MAG: winged helix-turn-helix transcriptional regulator [Phycisphaerales bacterium]|nr:MAG: winged helix-turn-helix transcriptional regulator [Phycisphaerales bacterium]